MKIESIVDLAKRHMELWIIKGEYEPGQKLKEEEIAMRLGISRPPIREIRPPDAPVQVQRTAESCRLYRQ